MRFTGRSRCKRLQKTGVLSVSYDSIVRIARDEKLVLQVGSIFV